MNKNHTFPFLKESFDQNTLRILYYKNKMYIIPLMAIFVAVLLFFFAVIPQIQEYFTLKDEEKNIQERISILKTNTSFLSSVNAADVDSKFQTSLLALPVEKDFDGILSVIQSAANDANVTLGDYSLQIGDLSTPSTKVITALPLEVNLTVNTGLVGMQHFMAALAKRLPLSEVTKIQISETSSTLTLVFYYKPLPSLSFDGTQKLTMFSGEQNTTMNKLSTFSK